MATETQLHAIPLWLLREYLEELGGESMEEDRVLGQGWQASLEKMPPRQLGALRVGIVQITIEGEPDVLDILLPELEKKTMRAGA
ncbi:MAG: DUF1952 domain-containing protein [Candidatus Promineifilaceae bacterium]|jgi:hypothetical protein